MIAFLEPVPRVSLVLSAASTHVAVPCVYGFMRSLQESQCTFSCELGELG